MFVDTAGVILLEPQKKLCETLFIDDESDKVKDHTKDVRIAYDDPLLRLVSREKKMITKYDIAEDPHYSDIKEVCGKRFLEMESSIAIPLIYKNQVKGVFSVGHKKSGHFYTREDIDLLSTLANHGIVAVENARLFEENLEKERMEEELKIAHDIQTSMLPEKAPEIEGFKIAARSIAAREVGGDFYDFIEIRSSEADDRLAIVVGDVSGKGVSAALVMAASRSTYRALSDSYSSVEKVISLANQRLNRDIKKGMFVALIYAVLSPTERILTLSNAGQTQPIICTDGESKPSYIVTDGDTFPQGIVKDCQYLEKQVKLKEGNTVVFYTDGVVEAMNEKEEMYGFERLIDSIDKGRELDANTLLERLMDDVTLFVGGAKQHDDLTIIVVKVEQ
jgi:serine phosphatase RsbU (regulator of sigma subunit)